MSESSIEYSERIHVGNKEFRVVSGLPPKLRGFLLPEEKWREVGVVMSKGWDLTGWLFGSAFFERPANENKPILVDQKSEKEKPYENKQRPYYLVCLIKDYPVSIDSSDFKVASVKKILNRMLQLCHHERFGLKQRANAIFSTSAYFFWRLIPHFSWNEHEDKNVFVKYSEACVSVAAKVEEDTVVIPFKTFSEVSGTSKEELLYAEKKLCSVLGFHLLVPSVTRCVSDLLQKVHLTDKNTCAYIDYLVNLSTVHCLFPLFSPMIVAEVCVGLTFPQFVTPSNQQQFSDCQKRLYDLVQNDNDKALDIPKIVFVKAFDGKPKDLVLISEKKLEESCCRDLFSKCDERRKVVTGRNYSRLEKISGGAYGEVFLAKDTSTSEENFVNKVMKEDFTDGISQSFLIETSIMTTLDHPHVTKIFDPRLKQEKAAFYMSKYESFSKKTKEKQLSPAHVRKYSRQLLEAVAYIHSRDVMHRDIKPQNILLDEKDNALLTDFGIALFTDRDGYRNDYNFNVCTLWYRAPEALLQLPYTKNFDIWSLGCTMCEMVTGKALFTGNNEAETILLICSKTNIADIIGNKQKFLQENPKYLPEFFEEKLKERSGQWKDQEWNHFKDLLTKVMALHPDYRISAEDALKHPFFSEQVLVEDVKSLTIKEEESEDDEEEEKEETPADRATEIHMFLNMKIGNFDPNMSKVDNSRDGIGYFFSELMDLYVERDSVKQKILIGWQTLWFAQIALPIVKNDSLYKELLNVEEFLRHHGLRFGRYIGLKQDFLSTEKDVMSLYRRM